GNDRGSRRISSMMTLMIAAAALACSTASHHELDFWLGTWEVRDGTEVVATSTIERAANGCVIRESYVQKDGYSGTSLSFHDPVLGKWRQTWVDSTGGVGEFSGTFADGAMRFEGETHTASGKRVFRKMTLASDNGRVRQTSLKSMDGSKWEPHYELLY